MSENSVVVGGPETVEHPVTLGHFHRDLRPIAEAVREHEATLNWKRLEVFNLEHCDI
jgi:hypothetical protein